jgi:hypothetical protein
MERRNRPGIQSPGSLSLLQGPELLGNAPHAQAAPLEEVAQQFTRPETRYVIAVKAVTRCWEF